MPSRCICCFARFAFQSLIKTQVYDLTTLASPGVVCWRRIRIGPPGNSNTAFCGNFVLFLDNPDPTPSATSVCLPCYCFLWQWSVCSPSVQLFVWDISLDEVASISPHGSDPSYILTCLIRSKRWPRRICSEECQSHPPESGWRDRRIRGALSIASTCGTWKNALNCRDFAHSITLW